MHTSHNEVQILATINATDTHKHEGALQGWVAFPEHLPGHWVMTNSIKSNTIQNKFA